MTKDEVAAAQNKPLTDDNAFLSSGIVVTTHLDAVPVFGFDFIEMESAESAEWLAQHLRLAFLAGQLHEHNKKEGR